MRYVVLVMGDRFTHFDNVEGCVTFSVWRSQPKQPGYLYYPGQGLSLEQRNEVLTANTAGAQRLLPCNDMTLLASREKTHKHNRNNVLITFPQRLDEHHFEAELVVQHDNELILDHVTGYHLQGMLFLEATRQLASAVVEQFRNRSDQYYIMHDIHAEYHNFAFPVDTRIQLHIEPIETDAEGQETLLVSLRFLQLDKVVVSTSGSFTAIGRDAFLNKEARLAMMAVRKQCRRVSKAVQSVTAEQVPG